MTHKFTGKKRDSESGLDYFDVRYYSSSFGRFFSPDEFTGGPVDAISSSDPTPPGPLPYADVANPQSLNKFAYACNNPVRYIDGDGHCTNVITALICIAAGVAVAAYLINKGLEQVAEKADKAKQAQKEETDCILATGSTCDPDAAKQQADAAMRDVLKEAAKQATLLPRGPYAPRDLTVDRFTSVMLKHMQDEESKRKDEERKK